MAFSWLEEDPDRLHMRMALAEAEAARREGEVPVGAVVFHPERGIVGRAHNQKERLRDATAHAEILSLGQASVALDSWRLEGTTLYTTLEPCPMCAGAIVQARVSRVVFGALDPKAGAVESVLRIFAPGLFNHDVSWTAGVLAEECGAMLSKFFRDRRYEGDSERT
ncbi:MAG: tRNA adenosine(34) deaminase TadA [Planctomycetes bacterium]|nr:tRNA adenosine(34) deaminase TadA [Planctomycetota bacterium]